MDTYELKLCGVKRELPFIDLEDNLAFASFVIMGDTELITACAPELAEKIGDVDVIITAEAKGIALAYEISRLLGKRNLLWQERVSNPICAAWYRYRCIPSRPPGSSICTWTAMMQSVFAAKGSASWTM